MRILLASDFYAPFVGGAERQTQLLARQLARMNHEVHVATIWHDGLQETEDDKNVIIHRVKGLSTRIPWFSNNPQRRYHPPFPDPSVVIGLRKIIRQLKPDIINSSGWIAYSCAIASIGSSAKFVLSARDYSHFCAIHILVNDEKLCTGPELLKCVRCAIATHGNLKGTAASIGVYLGGYLLRRRLKAIHSISQFVGEKMTAHFLNNRPTQILHQVIPSFLDDNDARLVQNDNFSESAFVQSLPHQGFILFVGALQKHKGLYVLLAAYAKLINPPPLILIGTMWSDTPKAFPEGVQVFSDVPHAEVMAAWNRCLFGVAPGLWPEPLGNVVMEGMSQGKPIIGTTPGGHTDLILHEVTGLLINLGDVDGLAQAMERLIQENELRTRLGKAARDHILAHFTARYAVPEFDQFYRRIMNSESRSSVTV